MQNKIPQRIFLSSTYEDLEQHRAAVMTVLQSFQQVFVGMENFNAADASQLQVCLKNLEQSNFVLCLIGTRYGTCPEGQEKSYTQLEVEHAVAKGIPLRVYMLDENKQPVLAMHIETDPQRRARLDALKQMLRHDRMTVSFTTPENLATKVARDFVELEPSERRSGFTSLIMTRAYRECAYDALAEWYDLMYPAHWSHEEPCETICSILGSIFDSRPGSLGGLRVLDCACGTGNTLVAFTNRRMTAFGTDGSFEMLVRAKKNCETANIPVERLITQPINWTDLEGYLQHFRAGEFDVIVNTANSLCHVPATDAYLGKALRNFYELLKPGGVLLVDTKKYIRANTVDGVPIYKELQLDGLAGEWIERTSKTYPGTSSEFGDISFHTRLVYDIDPAIEPKVCRALIVITLDCQKLTPRTLVVPYYPLPARILQEGMQRVGFETTCHPAYDDKFMMNWKYDIVVGKKPI